MPSPAPRFAHFLDKGFRNAEMLKQRNDVGEGLVKRQHIRIGGFLIAAVEAIEQRMCGFVRDDIVGDGAEDTATPAM